MARKAQGQKSIILRLLVLLFAIYLSYTLVSLELQFISIKSEANAAEKVLAEKTAKVQELTRLIEEGNEKALLEKAARERLGYVYPDEQVFIDPSGS